MDKYLEDDFDDFIDPIDEDEEDRMGQIPQRSHKELWAIHRKNGKVTWGDVYAHILARPDIYYSKDEIDPEIWGIFNTDPNTEMICIVDDYDGKDYWIPKFDDGSAQPIEHEEMIRKANDWKVTASILLGMMASIAIIFGFVFYVIHPV